MTTPELQLGNCETEVVWSKNEQKQKNVSRVHRRDYWLLQLAISQICNMQPIMTSSNVQQAVCQISNMQRLFKIYVALVLLIIMQ